MCSSCDACCGCCFCGGGIVFVAVMGWLWLWFSFNGCGGRGLGLVVILSPSSCSDGNSFCCDVGAVRNVVEMILMVFAMKMIAALLW